MADNAAKDVSVLGDLVTKLQVAYGQYFTGGLNREPLDLVRQVEDIIHTYNVGQLPNPVLRFRFNSLVARYNSFRHVWEKRKRKMEGAEAPKAYSLKPGPREESFTAIVNEYPLKDDQVSDIFDHYIILRKRCKEPVSAIRIENFKAVLNEHLAKIKDRTNCSSFMVKVDIQDKKSRISVKPFE